MRADFCPWRRAHVVIQRSAIALIFGIILLVVLQAGNSSVFDRVFPVAKVINVPPGLDAHSAKLLTY
jgi:hypothetical protein